MRRALLAAGVVAALALPALSGPEDLGADTEGLLIAPWGLEESEPAFAVPDERIIDVDALPEPVQPFVRELLRDPVSIEVTAFRRRGAGAADAFLAGDAALAGAADLDALRAELAAGTLVEVGRTSLTAEPGEPVGGEDLTDVGAALSSDIEAAIEVAVTYSKVGRVRTGLAARMLPFVGPDGTWNVRYKVIVGADADVRDVETVAGRRSTVRTQAFSALGTATLRDGESAVVRGLRPPGDGFVVVLRAVHLPDVRLPRRLGGGWYALPGVLGDTDGSASLGYVGTTTSPTWRLDDPVEAAIEGPLSAWWSDLEPPPTEEAWAERARELLTPEVGVCLAGTVPGEESDLAVLAAQALEERVPRTVSVTQPETGRLVVPALGGHAAGGFLGTLRTTPDGLGVETGCHACIGVAEDVASDGHGLSFAAVLGGDGGLEIDVCARVEEERVRRTFPARRSLPGHSAITHDDVTFEFATERIVRARTRVPAGGARVAGEVDVAVTGATRDDALLQPVDVDGRRLWLAPGAWVRLLVHHRTPHVVDWGWEASCGMTYRAPHVSTISAGTQAALRLRDDRIELAAVLTRPPNLHAPAFDMKDGVVEVLRQPFLMLRTRLPRGDLGRVARGAGCELRVDVPGASRASLRTSSVTAGGESWTVRHADGEGVLFAAGGTWWLPESVRQYVSNHQSGEAVVEPAHRQDGVLVVLDEADAGVARGRLSVRTRPDLSSHDLVKYQAPDRPDTELSLLVPDQRVRRVPLVVPLGRTVERTTPGGMPDPVRFRTTEPSEEDDE